MQITRFSHSCLLVEDGDARLLLDPGIFSSGFEELRGLTGVLLTHQHPDHLDADRLRRLLDANPEAALHCDSGSAETLDDLPLTVVDDGTRLDLGTPVQVVGSLHAVIHEDIPRVPNVGYAIGDRFFTPGDALGVPDDMEAAILGLPTAAPWLKASEAVDLMRRIRPRLAFPVHGAGLATPKIWWTLFTGLQPDGTTFVPLDQSDAVPA